MDKRAVTKRWVSFGTSLGVNGLGVPTVDVYFSYCDKKEKTGSFCKGCHNAVLQKDGVGKLLTFDEILKIIEKKYNKLIKFYDDVEIAIMGGEPFADINLKFSQEIAKRYKTIIYTWRMPEHLAKIDVTMFDRIVCGEYKEELSDENYILGSTNQIIVNNKLEIIQ